MKGFTTAVLIGEGNTEESMTYLYVTGGFSYLFKCWDMTSVADAYHHIANFFKREYDGIFLITLNHYQTLSHKKIWLKERGYNVSGKKLAQLDELIERHFSEGAPQ